MQVLQDSAQNKAALSSAIHEPSPALGSPYADCKVIRRNGAVVGFEPGKIAVALTKAFLAVNGSQGAASARIRELVAALTEGVVGALMRRQPAGGAAEGAAPATEAKLCAIDDPECEVCQ